MCTNVLSIRWYCDGTQHHVTLQGLTAEMKKKASKDVDLLSMDTQELGSTTSEKNFGCFC